MGRRRLPYSQPVPQSDSARLCPWHCPLHMWQRTTGTALCCRLEGQQGKLKAQHVLCTMPVDPTVTDEREQTLDKKIQAVEEQVAAVRAQAAAGRSEAGKSLRRYAPPAKVHRHKRQGLSHCGPCVCCIPALLQLWTF